MKNKAKLTNKQRRALRALAHSLKPVVHVGKDGITEQVIMAVDDAIFSHELIKVRILEAASENRRDAARELATRAGAELVSLVGRMVVLYRQHPEEPKIEI